MIATTSPVIIITNDELNALIGAAVTKAIEQAKKSLPRHNNVRPVDVNQTVAAKMLNISRPKIKRMLNAGILRLNKFGRIPIEQIDAALAAD